ncbi:MAG: hypothetical protein IE933_03465 [Sphingomonadales bacterium]|nr:hypothetical protein [Sphingomonadales bacterium]MBD3772101.1 hypothetical protein [Paracoccaceae bacterium]
MNRQARPSTGTGSRILDELAEVIGEQAALDLAWAFRGIMLYIPKNPETVPGIAAAIGDEAAAKLCDTFWRMPIYMPFGEALARKVRAMDEAGTTRREIAMALGIAERRVYRILERGGDSRAADPRQSELF